jgi:hypothetical protein
MPEKNHKSKMQNGRFATVDEFLEFLPEEEWKVVDVLRRLVFTCMPDVTEKLSFNVPFYKRNKTVCFIWPASILWGKKKTYEGVRFGFSNGYLLLDENKYLNKGERKQVYWRDFASVKDINVDLLRAYLFEAIIIDDQTKSIKKKSANSYKKQNHK